MASHKGRRTSRAKHAVKVRVDQHRQGVSGGGARRDAQHHIGQVAVGIGKRPPRKHEVDRPADLLTVHLRSGAPPVNVASCTYLHVCACTCNDAMQYNLLSATICIFIVQWCKYVQKAMQFFKS